MSYVFLNTFSFFLISFVELSSFMKNISFWVKVIIEPSDHCLKVICLCISLSKLSENPSCFGAHAVDQAADLHLSTFVS